MRGLSVTNGEKSSFVNVFPPHAGVIGTSVEIHCGVFSPHAGVIGRLYWQNVDGSRIPPLAGVIGKSANIVVYRVGIPPVCGGYRSKSKIRLFEKWYSPPHAGVIGEAADGEMGPVRIPPARGGYRPTRCPGELAE